MEPAAPGGLPGSEPKRPPATGWRRYIPTRERLNGSWLHRVFGERLFHPKVWHFERESTCLGLGIGVFIALTPTFGFQFLLATITCLALRVNLPIALAACLITNPLTAPVVYAAQYQLGLLLAPLPTPSEVESYKGALRVLVLYGKPLIVGSLVSGGVLGLTSYAVARLCWQLISKLVHGHEKSHK